MADSQGVDGGPADAQRAAALADHVARLEADNRRLRAQLAAAGVIGDDGADAGHGPFFVGGTGRSGTWVVGRLVGQHPAVAVVRTELRFHASEHGFRRVLEGTESAQDYAQRVRERWFGLAGPGGRAKGLFLLATSAQLSGATRRLVELAPDDVEAGLRAFTHELVDPFAFGRGARTWIETTPDNSSAVDCLLRVFPAGRAIDIVRDGRDSASSVVSMPWGPNDLDEALGWWEQRVRAADAAIAAAPPDRVLRLRFEEFALTDRDAKLHELFEFCGLALTSPVRRSFDKTVDPARANVGRWRESLSRRDAASLNERYRAIYDALVADGVRCLPISPDEADALHR